MEHPYKRLSDRENINFPVTVEIDYGSNRKWVAKAINISSGGVLLWAARPLPLNVPLIIHFPFEWALPFALIKVIRRDGHFFGCEFIGLPGKDVDAMDHAIDDYRHHHPSAHHHNSLQH